MMMMQRSIIGMRTVLEFSGRQMVQQLLGPFHHICTLLEGEESGQEKLGASWFESSWTITNLHYINGGHLIFEFEHSTFI